MFKISMLERISAFALVGVLLALLGCVRGAIPTAVGEPAGGSSATHETATTHSLYVSGNVVWVFSLPAYRNVAQITTGINRPVGLWVDRSGNLYVANQGESVRLGRGSITQYAPGTHSPMCTYPLRYSASAVTTDDVGRVYATSTFEETYGNWAFLEVFSQCGKVTRTTEIGTPTVGIITVPGGIAVDHNGDIFVTYESGIVFGRRGTPRIRFLEFKQGGLKPIQLGVQIPKRSNQLTSALIIDKHGDLITTDGGHNLYIIRPPYTSVHLLVAGPSHPSNVSLNQSETLLYSANIGSKTVTIYNYPSGTLVKTLRVSFSGPNGVAVAPDATF